MTMLMALLFDAVIKSSVILGVTSAAALLMRRKSASLRHVVWTAGLMSALALPLLGLVLPAWQPRIAVLTVHVPAVQVATTAITTTPIQTTVTSAKVIPGASRQVSPTRLVFLIWILGLAVAVSLLLMEFVRLARVALHANSVQQPAWRNLIHDISNVLKLKRTIRLIRNPNASVLGTWGALRPRVLLPRESESWPRERMRVVLGHELAHVKRNDWIVQILAEVARAIYWFNPLFRVACSAIRRESEHACDDTAMRLGVDGPTYASHVLDLARSMKHCGQPGSAALAMASASNLERRLIAMLNPSLNRCVPTKGTIAIVGLLALGLTLPLAAMRSRSELLPMTTATVQSAAPISKTQQAAISPIPGPVPLATVRQTANQQTALVAFVPAAAVQIAPGAITGKVSDQSGALIPGVSVLLVNESNVQVRTLTNDSGSFNIPNLAPGNYSMKVSLPGFQTVAVSRLLVVSGQSNQLEVTMHIAPSFATVTVTTSLPPGFSGLRCISIFGNVKADGTPFTEADCPAGSTMVVLPPFGSAPSVPASAEADSVAITSVPLSPIQPPAQTSGRRTPIRVGGDVQAGNIIANPKPAYPAEARNKGIAGTVVLTGIIGVDGRLRSLKIVSSPSPVFNDPTIEAVQQWIYKPTLLNREPVEVFTTITVQYTFEG